jgi:hypothetical protein
MRKTKERYYVLVIKSKNRVIVSTNKELIASYAGVCVRTISRHLEHSSIYDTIHFTIWRDIPIERKKTGFALHS